MSSQSLSILTKIGPVIEILDANYSECLVWKVTCASIETITCVCLHHILSLPITCTTYVVISTCLKYNEMCNVGDCGSRQLCNHLNERLVTRTTSPSQVQTDEVETREAEQVAEMMLSRTNEWVSKMRQASPKRPHLTAQDDQEGEQVLQSKRRLACEVGIYVQQEKLVKR